MVGVGLLERQVPGPSVLVKVDVAHPVGQPVWHGRYDVRVGVLVHSGFQPGIVTKVATTQSGTGHGWLGLGGGQVGRLRWVVAV
jgi:hypothetical protein